MMTPKLSGKSIIVTGASRGIGRAIAEACASDGAMVGVNYRQSESAAKQIQSHFPETVELLPFDVGDCEASRKAVQSFINAHCRRPTSYHLL